MSRTWSSIILLGLLAAPAVAQEFPTADPALEAIWKEGMDRSQVYPLAQVLLDSIGPRLTGSPELDAAHDWLVALYGSWGIEAENQQYGTWKGWQRGVTHVDLIAPRVKTLDAMLLAWSRGTDGPVEAEVILLPNPLDDLAAWKRQARGKFLLTSPLAVTCRPQSQWEEFGNAAALEAMARRREAAQAEFGASLAALGVDEWDLPELLAEVGLAGTLSSDWPDIYGGRRIFDDQIGAYPALSLGCEDYGLVYRLARSGQGPAVRVDARATDLGEVPVFNTVGRIPGTVRPDEYVLLSAHLDSWDGGQGATDNGTGTVIMAEAMRLLKKHYPNPKRTILVGHWGSEEQGLNGSRAFAADHPDIVAGLQAVFNQDNGTGALSNVSMQGLLDAGPHFVRWLGAIPSVLTAGMDIEFPGVPGSGSSDYAAFTCAGAPSFGLWSDDWDYDYTWHTNLDTLDKLSFHNVRSNATLIAMLAYMASEDPEFVSRERRTNLPVSHRTGEPGTWPVCRMPDRDWSGYGR